MYVHVCVLVMYVVNILFLLSLIHSSMSVFYAQPSFLIHILKCQKLFFSFHFAFLKFGYFMLESCAQLLNHVWLFVTSRTVCGPPVSSVTQSCPTLCDPMNCSTPGLPVHYQLPEFTQTCVHWVGDAIQPSHPLSSPSPPAPDPSQHQGLFQWVNSSHEVAKVLEFQLQRQSFHWTPRTDLL